MDNNEIAFAEDAQPQTSSCNYYRVNFVHVPSLLVELNTWPEGILQISYLAIHNSIPPSKNTHNDTYQSLPPNNQCRKFMYWICKGGMGLSEPFNTFPSLLMYGWTHVENGGCFLNLLTGASRRGGVCISYLIIDLELLIPRVCLQQRGSCNEGLSLDWVIILQVETGNLEVSLQLVVIRILSEKSTTIFTNSLMTRKSMCWVNISIY